MRRVLGAAIGLACAVSAWAPASAEITVTPFQSGQVQLGSGSTTLGATSLGVLEDATGGVTYLNKVTTDGGPIIFESGVATGGSLASARFTSGVDVTITNTTGAAFIPELHSSIIPAGMGVFMAQVTDACLGARYTGCAPSTEPRSLSGLTPAGFVNVPFAVSNIAFEVTSGGQVLYSVAASISFTANFAVTESGALAAALSATPAVPSFITYDGQFADAQAKLTGFEIVADPNVPGHFGFRWDATAFSVAGLAIDPGQSRTFQYRATVSTLSLVNQNDVTWPVVLYAGFGDPIGRPGAGCCLAVSYTPLTFSTPTLTVEDGRGIVALTLESAIPEPQVWALMIGGFGLVGGALRRGTRRRTA